MSKLRRRKQVDDSLFDQELLIGNPETPLRILMVASLGCGVCRKGFQKASKLIAKYPDQAHLAIRLQESGKGTTEDTSASNYLIRYWQKKIHGKPEASLQLRKVFEDWFSLPSIKTFMKKYPMQENGLGANGTPDLANRQYKWVNETGLYQTPMFFLNSYRLPLQYEIGDLAGMMPGLAKRMRQDQWRDRYPENDQEIASTKKRSKV